MILAELLTITEINAPAERVWQVLTDFRRYPEWNPYIRRVQGEALKRSELDLLIQRDGKPPVRVKPRIVTFRPPRELRWFARLLLPGLIDREHRFVVEPLGAERSRLIHEGRARGLLVPFFRRMFNGQVQRGFEAMDGALKRVSERRD
jgi:hypothetical protein